MPSRARRVKLYKEEVPLFYRHGVEDRLDAMHSPIIQLRSGGSIVIHTTEALTAIDVNSGRSTRERNIEETALKTNLEAADEIARQLRLRDLAGLVVVDFIDMAEMRNQRSVERRLRDALKTDRARVQLGRISAFGLLELSRQRLRPSFQELSTQPCPTCNGVGAVRSTESAALQVLRAIEVEGLKGTVAAATVTVPLPAALYVLNQKRDRLVGLETRYDMKVEIRIDEHLIAGQFSLERSERALAGEVIEAPAEAAAEVPPVAAAGEEEGEGKRRRRRRRRRKRPSDLPAEAEAEPLAARPNGKADGALAEFEAEAEPADAEDGAPAMAEAAAEEAVGGEQMAEESPKRPRRRRAGTRRPRTKREPEAAMAAAEVVPDEPEAVVALAAAGAAESAEVVAEPVELEAAPGAWPEAADERATAPASEADGGAGALDIPQDQPMVPDHAVLPPEPDQEPAGGTDYGSAFRQPEAPADDEESEEESAPEMPSAVVEQKRGGPPRRGWWSRFARKDD
jgi:ribonuclease E